MPRVVAGRSKTKGTRRSSAPGSGREAASRSERNGRVLGDMIALDAGARKKRP